MRLSAGASWRGHPTREQQVLHYQWFADLGSAEAQRALGQMLTQGVQRDPEQAFRYFRCAYLPSTDLVPAAELGLPQSDFGGSLCFGFGRCMYLGYNAKEMSNPCSLGSSGRLAVPHMWLSTCKSRPLSSCPSVISSDILRHLTALLTVLDYATTKR